MEQAAAMSAATAQVTAARARAGATAALMGCARLNYRVSDDVVERGLNRTEAEWAQQLPYSDGVEVYSQFIRSEREMFAGARPMPEHSHSRMKLASHQRMNGAMAVEFSLLLFSIIMLFAFAPSGCDFPSSIRRWPA